MSRLAKWRRGLVKAREAEMAAAVDALTDRPAFWRWVANAARPYVGWILVALGALALFLGWYGVSGQSLTAKQLPYLVSGGLTGVALILIAAVFLANDNLHRQLRRFDEIERKVDDLYDLLVIDSSAPTEDSAGQPAATSDDIRMALPSGSSYHRADCALVAGKPGIAAVTRADVKARGLRPCRVCEPSPPARNP